MCTLWFLTNLLLLLSPIATTKLGLGAPLCFYCPKLACAPWVARESLGLCCLQSWNCHPAYLCCSHACSIVLPCHLWNTGSNIKLWRTYKWRQQNVKPSMGPFWEGGSVFWWRCPPASGCTSRSVSWYKTACLGSSYPQKRGALREGCRCKLWVVRSEKGKWGKPIQVS